MAGPGSPGSGAAHSLSAPPPRGLSLAQVDELFLEDFQARADQLFLEFDYRPIAAASLAQVHQARLQDGTPVAVKVRGWARAGVSCP